MEDAMPQQHLLLGQVRGGVWDAHLQGIVVADKGANLPAKRIVMRREGKIHSDNGRQAAMKPVGSGVLGIDDAVDVVVCCLVSVEKTPVKTVRIGCADALVRTGCIQWRAARCLSGKALDAIL
jgi:hypothetical protein